MGRQTLQKQDRPFRFILNHSRAIAANVYLMLYPRSSLGEQLAQDSSLLRRLWLALNEISPEELIGSGRTYGGSLHKLEPKELANAKLRGFAGHSLKPARYEQLRLLEKVEQNYP
jgi:hypothetical protein